MSSKEQLGFYSSVLTYRNLPEVNSDEECYYLMKQVTLGLQDIAVYLHHAIANLRQHRAFLLLRPTGGPPHDNRPRSSQWFRVVRAIQMNGGSWSRPFKAGIRIASLNPVEAVSATRIEIRGEVPAEVGPAAPGPSGPNDLAVYYLDVLDYIPSRNLILLNDVPIPTGKRGSSDYWFFYEPWTYQLHQYLGAVRSLIAMPPETMTPLLRLFQKKHFTSWPSVKADLELQDWLFLREDDENTRSQRQFVVQSLRTPDFSLLWGPPGSGKTTAIMELVYQAAKRGMRVLFCASTHVAIDQAVEKLLSDKKAGRYVQPIRIGDSDKISHKLRKYQLDQVGNETRNRIISRLMFLGKRTPSQETLLQALASEDGDIWVERLLVDSANLVCGTTVGILQAPEIRASAKYSVASSYDILVIDEASKTTFHEFLVPARFATRWVLCGDPMQLSPYVDEEDVAATIREILPAQEHRQCCHDVFRAGRRKKHPEQILLVSQDDETREQYIRQASAKGLDIIEVGNDTDFSDFEQLSKLLGAQLIVCSASRAKSVSGLLPGSVEILRTDEEKLDPLFQARRAATQKENAPERTWEQELAIAIGNEFYTRDTTDGTFDRYRERKDLLYPEFPIEKNPEGNDEQDDSRSRFEKRLDRIRLCAYPSILELLIKGFRPDSEFESTLNKGFEDRDLKQRLVKLRYQFRMHPEISSFPRKFVYSDEALKDGAPVLVHRQWSFPRFGRHSIWIDVRGKMEREINADEIRIITDELMVFLDWARDNSPREHDYWGVAILSFYNSQVSAIEDVLLEMPNLTHQARGVFEATNAEIRVGTVDSIQGREADLVFLSMVRTEGTGIGFLSSPNRLNVAVTRARIQLVLVGDKEHFASQDESHLLTELAQLPDDTFYRRRVQ